MRDMSSQRALCQSFLSKNLKYRKKRKKKKKTKMHVYSSYLLFLDLAILDLGNVNFVNKIDFGKE